MTRRLITVILAASLFAATPAWVRAQKAQEGKPPATDEKQKALEEAILGLRDLLYGDKTLDEALDFFVRSDKALGSALTDLRAKDYAHALATLRAANGRPSSDDDLSYWLAVAAAQRGAGNLVEAKAAARHLLSAKETRTHIEAWTVLRELGETPPASQAEEVLGVVVELALDEGVVIIAGFSDGAARYFFSRGGGVIGDNMPESVKQAAKSLTQTAAPLARTMATGVRRELPANKHVRVTLLTPSGMHAAEVADDSIRDPKNSLHGVYMAAYKLFQEIQQVYKDK